MTTPGATTPTSPTAIERQIAALPWPDLHEALDAQGFALTAPLLDTGTCRDLARSYDTGRFRATITMADHRFGEGEYKYLDHPLPELVTALRRAFYPPLAAAADRWAERLGDPTRYPATLEELLSRCHGAGQDRPTPLLLRYGPGGWNALHQDLYGEVAFPFQVVTVLDRAGEDFTGGELTLVEQRPRAQSRVHVVSPPQGSFLIFANRHRPTPSTNGFARATMRHGVSTVLTGQRTALGIIFHDAR